MPKDDKTKCKICNLEKCKECEGSSDLTKCAICEEDYILSGNKCLKNCKINENTQCKKCSEQEGKIDQCLECNKGFYLPEDNYTHCKKCPIENCEICEHNKCIKCFDNYLYKIENDSIVSCYNEIPERIDIIRNGKLNKGVIELLNGNTIKTQLSDSLKYYVQDTCSAPRSSNWWKRLDEKCNLDIFFNISKLLPNNQIYLQDDYDLYFYASKKYEAIGASSREYMPHPFFFGEGGKDWGGYVAQAFGVYKDLETINHNGYIFVGGIYNRGKENGYEYLSLDGFNYTTIIKNGTGNIGWSFYVRVGQYSSATVKTRITVKIKDLFLIRKKK